jgi:hypothetical protein
MPDKKSHAAEQRAHYERKMSTHQRVCVRVPREQADAAKVSIDRLLKRLAKRTGTGGSNG